MLIDDSDSEDEVKPQDTKEEEKLTDKDGYNESVE